QWRIPVQAGQYHGIQRAAQAQHHATFLFVHGVEAGADPDDSGNDQYAGDQAATQVAIAAFATGKAAAPAFAAEDTGELAHEVVQQFVNVGRALVLLARIARSRAPGIVLAI